MVARSPSTTRPPGTHRCWHLGESGFARVSLSGMEPLYIFLPGAFNDFEGRDTISLMVDAKRGVALIDTATGRLNRWVPGWDVSKGAYGEVFETQALYVLASEEGLIEIRSLVDDSILHRFTELQTALRESKNKPLYFGGTVAQFDPSFRTLLGQHLGADVVYPMDLATGKADRLPDLTGTSGGPTFTPDHTQFATADTKGNVTLRDANTFPARPVRTFLSNRAVAGEHLVRFLADGRLMMTVGDGKAQLWDFASGERIGDVFPAADSWTGAPSGDLRWLVTAIDGRAIRWDLDVDAWPAVACRAARPQLDPSRMGLHGPDDSSYAATCSQYPSLKKEAVPS